ncbi:MAG: hypothetical protein ACI9LO_002099 [Planctomycetota bacterium]|jgi:hypothetical protein
MNAAQHLALSQTIEDILVARNPRGMKSIQATMHPGYCLRAAQILHGCRGNIFIGTGFPVVKTFETDGPVGAIALYEALAKLGATPTIVCGKPLSNALSARYRVHEIRVGAHDLSEHEAEDALAKYSPEAVISIERPGQASDGGYYNMRGESISEYTACFDNFMNMSNCPTIGIGDGGNEIGMGNVTAALKDLNIIPAVTQCDELIVSDVSNWGAYGIIAFLSVWNNRDLLAEVSPMDILTYISALGSVDGVTRENRLTEDSLNPAEGESVILQLRQACGFSE